jgi:hypothetical protein
LETSWVVSEEPLSGLLLTLLELKWRAGFGRYA